MYVFYGGGYIFIKIKRIRRIKKKDLGKTSFTKNKLIRAWQMPVQMNWGA